MIVSAKPANLNPDISARLTCTHRQPGSMTRPRMAGRGSESGRMSVVGSFFPLTPSATNFGHLTDSHPLTKASPTPFCRPVGQDVRGSIILAFVYRRPILLLLANHFLCINEQMNMASCLLFFKPYSLLPKSIAAVALSIG
jgi:hypothetical protein